MCDPIWQVTLRSCEKDIYINSYTALYLLFYKSLTTTTVKTIMQTGRGQMLTTSNVIEDVANCDYLVKLYLSNFAYLLAYFNIMLRQKHFITCGAIGKCIELLSAVFCVIGISLCQASVIAVMQLPQTMLMTSIQS